MATPEYDALVVGARVAGATVAARLAQQGRKVLLVDRDEFPSDTLFDGAEWEATMEAYAQRRDTMLRPQFEQTIAATALRDDPGGQLDPLRAVLLNQHDARRVIRALPGLLDQVFEPMDRFRHAFIANLYEGEAETRA